MQHRSFWGGLWQWVKRSIFAGSVIYVVGLLVWMLLWQLAADRWWWLFVVNSLAMYLWLPLPLVGLGALLIRSRRLIGIVLVMALFGFGIFGVNVAPTRQVSASGPMLSFASYNVLGSNRNYSEALELIRSLNADVIGLQELGPEMAEQISSAFREEYPYQWIEARPGVSGMGLLSRYPLEPVRSTNWSKTWIGDPQLARITVDQRVVTVLNFHAIAPLSRLPASGLTGNVRERERHAATIVELAQQNDGPFVALGDLNATSRNHAYRLLNTQLADAWEGVGSGFGHTWPSRLYSPIRHHIPVRMLDVLQLKWLVRIDYVFHSRDLVAIDARIAAHGAGSDHRPVAATLMFTR